MIRCTEYTKYELAKELNVDATKTSNITRKLTSLGYEFKTQGRGDNYRITLLSLPIEKSDRTIEVMTSILNDELLLNLPPSAQAFYCKYSDKTIKKYIDKMIEEGSIKKNEGELFCYLSKKVIVEEDFETGDYKFYREYKKITNEEAAAIRQIYTDTYQKVREDGKDNVDVTNIYCMWAGLEAQRKYVKSNFGKGWYFQDRYSVRGFRLEYLGEKIEQQGEQEIYYQKGNSFKDEEDAIKRREEEEEIYRKERVEKAKLLGIKLEEDAATEVKEEVIEVEEEQSDSRREVLKDNKDMPIFDANKIEDMLRWLLNEYG